jgi:hypothetical protein
LPAVDVFVLIVVMIPSAGAVSAASDSHATRSAPQLPTAALPVLPSVDAEAGAAMVRAAAIAAAANVMRKRSRPLDPVVKARTYPRRRSAWEIFV